MICFHVSGPRGEGGSFLSGPSQWIFNRLLRYAGVDLMLSDTVLMWSEGGLLQVVKCTHIHIVHSGTITPRKWSFPFGWLLILYFKNVHHILLAFFKGWWWFDFTLWQLTLHQKCRKHIKECYIIIYVCLKNKKMDRGCYISTVAALKC